MAIKSNEETPAIIVLRARLAALGREREWALDRRESSRRNLDEANEALVDIAGQTDNVEAALKTLVNQSTQAADLASLITQQEAVDRLGGVL
jgi:uncharacterized protein (DUF3084 family)